MDQKLKYSGLLVSDDTSALKSSSTKQIIDLTSSGLTRSVDASENRRPMDLEFVQSGVFGGSTKTKSLLKVTRSRDESLEAGGSRPQQKMLDTKEILAKDKKQRQRKLKVKRMLYQMLIFSLCFAKLYLISLL